MSRPSSRCQTGASQGGGPAGGDPHPAQHLHPWAELTLQAPKVDWNGGSGRRWNTLVCLPPLSDFPSKSHSKLGGRGISSNHSQGPGTLEPDRPATQQVNIRYLLNWSAGDGGSWAQGSDPGQSALGRRWQGQWLFPCCPPQSQSWERT